MITNDQTLINNTQIIITTQNSNYQIPALFDQLVVGYLIIRDWTETDLTKFHYEA